MMLASVASEGYTPNMLKTQEIREIFARFAAQNPAPETELFHTNHYTLLVAVVLSAQATDKGVNKATPALFKIADTPEKMLALGEERLRKLVQTIGLYNSKAKNIILLSKKLVEEHHSQVPNDRKALEALPGVGTKTAAVVMNCAFGEPTIAVDTHVFRVANRIGLVNTASPDKTEAPLTKKLNPLLPKDLLRHVHHWLILHGRYICIARKPKCDQCVIRDLCRFKGKSI